MSFTSNFRCCFVAAFLHGVTLTFLLSLSVSRLEERESDTKKEYSKLHERYTDVSLLFWVIAVSNAFLT